MDTILITSRKKLALPDIERKVAGHWPVEYTVPGALVLDGPGTRVYIWEGDNPDVPPELSQVQMDYTSVELAKRVLEVVADDPNLTVDLDFDVVMRGDELVARIRAEPEWDWRRDFLARLKQEGRGGNIGG